MKTSRLLSGRLTASWPRVLGLVSACAFLWCTGPCLVTASAATNFCPSGSGAGRCEWPFGVAVDNSGGPNAGSVYLADVHTDRVDAFDSQGDFSLAFGFGVLNGAEELQTCTTATGCIQGNYGRHAGQLAHPSSVAVDDSPGGEGDLYVSEPGVHRIQKFTPSGEFLLSAGGGVLDGGATGTGDLTAGSASVTNVATSSRQFAVGQTLTGAGIPAKTRIAEIVSPGDEIVLTQPATASGSGVVLTAPTPPANVSENEVQTVSLEGVPTGGSFALSFPFDTEHRKGRSNVGGGLVATTTPGSAAVTSVSGVGATGNITAGSTTVTFVHQVESGFVAGRSIVGVGIQSGTTVVETTDTADSGSYILSQPATATATAVPFAIVAHGTGDLVAGSNVVSHVSPPVENGPEFGNLLGLTVTGVGIPAGTTITGEDSGERTVTLSASATLSGADVALSAESQVSLAVGEAVSGPGIAAGATVSSVAADGDFQLSAKATASASSVGLHAGLPFDAAASEVQSALEALGNIGPGGVGVSGSPGGPWRVEFRGSLADTNVAGMRADGSGLTPSGAATVITEVEGASAPEVCTAAEVAEGYLCVEGVGGRSGGQLGGSEQQPIALDASGDVWVGSAEGLEEFSRKGVFLSEVSLPGGGEVAALAVDSSGDFYTLKGPIEGQDEEQLITPPSSGSFTLTFDSQTTAPLLFVASDAEIQAALEALPAIGPGNVSVYRSKATFGGAFTNTDVPQLIASAGATVQTVTQSVPEIPGVLSKRKPSGEVLDTLDASGDPRALGVDSATGDLFVSDQALGGATLLEFDGAGEQVEAFGAGEVLGRPAGNAIAVGDGAGRVYVAGGGLSADGVSASAQSLALPAPGPLASVGATEASPVGKASATLRAVVNPEGRSTTYHFQYVSEQRFKEDGESFGAGTLETPESASIGSDFTAHSVSTAVSSLATATAYRFRVVANNENGTNDGETAGFSTLPPAVIESTGVANVTAESADLQAEVNPLGDATTYQFEYVSEAAFRAHGFAEAVLAPAAPVAIGAGDTLVAVSQHVDGLAPGTSYRYRLVARNVVSEANGGPFPGSTLTFTTQTPGVAALPDGRGWEQVTPPDKRGSALYPIGLEEGPIQASADGDAVTYSASAPTEPEPQGSIVSTQVFSARTTGGWASRDINLPHSEATGLGVGRGREYVAFSRDLSLAALNQAGAFYPLSPRATEQTPYLRTDFVGGDASSFCDEACYQPLVSGAPGFADVPEGAAFGEEGKCPPAYKCGPTFAGSSPDLAHVILQSQTPLTVGAPAYTNLYEWSAGSAPAEALRLVTVMPGGEPLPPDTGASVGLKGARNSVSADGSRVVFQAGNGHLYLRENATQGQSEVVGGGLDGSQCIEPSKACTIELDTLQGGVDGSETPQARFQFASPDGVRVFFTDPQMLTPDAGGASRGGGDLYEYDSEKPAGESLTDLTPAVSGEAAEVQGDILGASEDGSYLYFVAKGALTGSQASGRGEVAQSGQFNLYLRHEGATSFLAALSPDDLPDWNGAAADGGNLESFTARVSPDGRWLAFMSERSITGYDNRDAVSGKRDEEVFLYHAGGESEEGKLICASCDPTGARPFGVEYKDLTALVGGDRVWEGSTWLAANIPGWTPYETGGSLYQSRYLSDSGRLFFNSSDVLVPQDSNGTEDVYEYEPPKGGEDEPASDSCTTDSPTYGSASGGCVSLISSGASPEASAFLDASESGGDVFFLTSGKLSPGDFDTSVDVYDARVGGGFPVPVAPIECSGDACQQPASAPSAPTPASLTFSGAGNLAPPPATSVESKSKPSKHAKKHTQARKPARRAQKPAHARKPARARRACRGKPGGRKRAACEKRARGVDRAGGRAGGSRGHAGKTRKGGK